MARGIYIDLRKELLFCLLSSVFFFGSDVTLTAGNNDINFYLDPSPAFGPLRLGPGGYERSLLSCVISCISQFHDCYSVLYNSFTHICTPGGAIDVTSTPLTPSDGKLYKRVVCDLGSGEFRVGAKNNEAMCIGVFSDHANYMHADALCKQKDSYLMTVRSRGRLAILQDISNRTGEHLWLGCNDLKTEGTFVWVDSDQVVTDEEKANFFGAGEPNDVDGGDDCCQLSRDTLKLNDDTCDGETAYVCERRWT